jgi:glycosyltransferase involved in cell wall biosynthesis
VNERCSLPRLRLLFVARRYWPAVGGVESFLRQLARDLATRHEVIVLAHRIDDGPTDRLTDSLRPPPPFERFEDGGVRVHPLRISARERVLLAPLVSQIVPGFRRYAYGRARVAAAVLYGAVVSSTIAEEADDSHVLHMWGGDLVAAAAVKAARQLGVPSVVTPFAHRGQWGDGPADAFAYRAADRVIGLLDTDAAVYRALGVSKERLAVCGVCSSGLPSGGGSELRVRLGISGPLVLFLGVRRPYKGFDLLMASAALVAERLPGVTFAFVGPGPALTTASSSTRLLDVGVVDDAEKAAWLDAADLLCLPSRGEIFPGSILEAWSVGTPVLVSDLPTLRELVEKASGGVVAELECEAIAAAIIELLGDPERLLALGEAGRNFWSENCTVEAVAAWHEQLYTTLTTGEATACAA